MSRINQAQAGTAPRAHEDSRHPPQQQDRLECQTTTTAWSPASPSYASSNSLLVTPFSDAIAEAAALSAPTMQRAIGNHHTSSSSNRSPDSGVALKNEPRAAPMAASPYELDRDMMGMLANNWNLNGGPPRAPIANWGFEPTPTETQTFYDPDVLMTSTSNQPAQLSGSMMMTPSESARIMGMPTSEQHFGENPIMINTTANMQQPMTVTADPFNNVDSGFVMPYQGCTTLPVGDFPLYNGGSTYRSAFGSDSIHQFTPARTHDVDNQLLMDTTFQDVMGTNNMPTLFNEVAQPPAVSMTAINGGFEMPELSLHDDDDSDWNGSSSGFSNVSSSPIANNTLLTSSSSTVTSTSAQLTPFSKEGMKKPKRIRRLCSIAGCGKRARSQDLCIAHGGGRRCMVEGCEKSSQGGNMCIKHGGGKRCKHLDCDKAAQTNSLCKAHGGGPRCQFPGCTKSSQGGGFCRAHGGGKRCAAEGCNKGTQRGDFCALHGGSRFCEVSGCLRNDRGGGFCAHHGGGKRCSIANCNRSCRRNGLCSTHLRLLGHETSGKVANAAPNALPTSTGVTSV
ncbi:putative WRKY transcription factor 19 [Phytophthora citrophthora]|uniref:WRKY transcription factor 19 n=1 Tax=Phytophthora citrophthora TaxID=4793 RepID=A0AAD9LPU4_9STRA|nr:putative WRKY transcription factor 19 [Phytophthora citrophthora]